MTINRQCTTPITISTDRYISLLLQTGRANTLWPSLVPWTPRHGHQPHKNKLKVVASSCYFDQFSVVVVINHRVADTRSGAPILITCETSTPLFFFPCRPFFDRDLKYKRLHCCTYFVSAFAARRHWTLFRHKVIRQNNVYIRVLFHVRGAL